MANKGENRKMKAVASPRTRQVARKTQVWTVKGRPGPHSQKTSVPLALALRELLGVAQTLKEAKAVLNARQVLVDGTVRTKKGFPVGLFDVISLPAKNEAYRALFDSKGRVKLVKVDAKQASKVCKVVDKKAAPKG